MHGIRIKYFEQLKIRIKRRSPQAARSDKNRNWLKTSNQMTYRPTFSPKSRSLRALSSALLLVVLLATAFVSPEAQAACPGSGFTATGFVNLESCTEAKVGSDLQTISIPVPASTASGDLLVAVVMTDGSEDLIGPLGWIPVTERTAGNNDGTLAVFKRTSDGSEPASYSFPWSTNEQAIGYMMRFTGTDSTTLFTSNSAQNGTGAAVAPSLDTVVANTLVLRLFGQDDDDFGPPADGTVVAGYETITEDESSNGGNSTSTSSAFINQAVAGATGTATFAGGGNEQWAAITLGIQPGAAASPTVAPFSCPDTDSVAIGSQLVVFEECTSFQGGTDATAISIPAPASASVGDYMIAVINTDDNEIPFSAVPAGWSVLTQSEGGGVTLAIYEKFFTATEPANYNWTLNSNEQRYGYILSFTGASGLTVPTTPTVVTGTNASPQSPAVVTEVDNTLVLRIAANDDDDVLINPPEIISGFRNITSNSSSVSGSAVSSQAVYANQAAATTPGNTGTENFFLRNSNEFWRSTAIGIEPYEFRFSMPDTTASVCGVQQVTLQVTDRLGNLVTNFTGSVDLSITTTLVADAVGALWLDVDSSLEGTLGASTNGAATYTFDTDDDGEAVFDFHSPNATTVNFNLIHDDNGPTFTENSSFDPSLVVDDNCTFNIAHDGVAGTCSVEQITITLVDSESNQATIYADETVNVSLDLGAGGNFSVNTGAGTLAPDPDNDNNGAVSYTFVTADNAQVVLNYSNTTAQTINFDVEDPTNGFQTGVSSDPNLVISGCEIRISIADPSDESDVCSVAQITFRMTDAAGATITNYVGTLNIATSSTTGDWSGGNTNVVNNGSAGDGAATYLMDALDLGTITLNFTNSVVNAAINFNTTSTAVNGALLADSLTAGQDPDLDVQACVIDIQVTDSAAEVCSAGEVVSYTIRNRNGVAATDFGGLILLNTLEGRGDYVPTGENGTFSNGTPGNGFANYTFDTLDNGVLNLTFKDDIAGTVNLTSSGTGLTVDPGSDVDIVFSSCEFRISYPDVTPGASDVCSIEIVRITLVDSGGSTVTDYAGTINLSTTTGNGSWADPGALNGTLTDPFDEDGSAVYAFDATDNGVIDLAFTDLTNETLNINVSDGTTTDLGSVPVANDPDLVVGLCTFQISFDGGGGGSTHDDATFIGCSVQQVTIEIYDSQGNLDTDYSGTVSITTSTTNGNWLDGTSLGTLTDVDGDDDGVATYQFDDTDNGLATLEFANVNGETLNINLVDGVIVETGTEDPNLTVQSCDVTIGAQSCVAGTSTSISVDAQKPIEAQRGRLVLMVMMHEGQGEVTASPTFGGQNMTRIRRELNTNGVGNNLELWGILDEDFPAGTGPHTGSFAGLDNGPAMCLFYLTDVEQAFPQPDAGSPSDGQVNGTQGTNAGGNTGREVSITAVTPSANNSLVMSFVSNGSGGDYNNVAPDPPFTRLFQGPDANSTGFAGSSGEVILAAETVVQETYNGGGNPLRDNHIVASFAPLVTGPPVAEGFVPVTLFQTYSGNVSYRAIGNSLRTTRNSTNSCTFGSGDGPISATLTMPDEAGGAFDSTVTAAYLYWFGSGDFDDQPPGADFDDITLINPAAVSTAVTADGVYLIESATGQIGLDYYAAYKDVTALVSANGVYQVDDLDIDSAADPWGNSTACAGGFAMIVVYENDFEQLRVVNLFQGFQPFQNSSFALVPRNFRMHEPDLDQNFPNGQITHVTVEGDEDLSNGVESLEIQNSPGSVGYTPLITFYNPSQAEFNGTVTRPLYTLTDVDPGAGVEEYYLFDESLGENGYEIDFPGPDAGLPAPDEDDEIGNTPGVDIDTHYLTGDGSGSDSDVMNAFAVAEAEEITTRYSSGQDLVLLVSEVISVTNAPIADIEVFKTEVGTFKVGGSASYQFRVTNNGNGASSFGEATGEITLSDTLPVGMTFNAAGDVSGTGWVCAVTLDPGAFTCTYDIATTFAGGELDETSPGSGVGKDLPLITATVQIASAATFPLLNNDAKNIVRVIHTGGSCTAVANGLSPDPDTCDRSPEFDNVFDLSGGTVDINDRDDKLLNNNNVDSVTTNIKGVETDLSVQKTVVGVLEDDGVGQYRIRVTNLGPDATTQNFSIDDPQPAGVTFTTVVADAQWNCGDDAVSITPPLDCTYTGPSLAIGAFKDLFFNVDVDSGTTGNNVSNTVQVDSGLFNFDTNTSNDINTVITPVTAPPAAATEKFLLSVSSISTGSATIGGITFENDDLIIYDPLTDTAVLYFDNSALGYSVDDPNAVHLLPNGQVILSADGNSTISGVSFLPNDLVKYDPIAMTAVKYFTGNDYPAMVGENIDATYVLDNGDIIFSTESAVTGNLQGVASWSDSDLVRFTTDSNNDGTADDPGFTIYLDAEDTDVFGAGAVNVDAVYINVDGTDATAVIDSFDLSSDNESTVVSDDNAIFGQDDVVQLVVDDNENPDVTSAENLFFGNLSTGIFTASDNDRRLNALHTLQTGYLGLFAISQSQAGSTCEAGQFTITKLQGLSSDIDTDYFGSISISTSTGTGNWTITGGSSNLNNGAANDGAATYTFDGTEGGAVTLNLGITTVTPVLNINVSNGIVKEGGVDPNFSFNTVVTTVSYTDTFTTASFSNNEGAAWSAPWLEADDFNGVESSYDGSGTLVAGNSGAGVSTGNVKISGGKLSLTSNPSTASSGLAPSLARRVDVSSYAVTEDVILDFGYTYASLNGSDSIIVEVSSDGDELYDQTKTWVAFPAYTGLTGTNASVTTQSLNVTDLGGGLVFTGFLDVRFRVAAGYTLASQFNIENVELRTGSTDCDAGSAFDHYAISVGPTLGSLVTGNSGTIVSGISCQRTIVRVAAHNGGDLNSPSNETVTLTAFDESNVARGAWAKATGTGTLTEGSFTDGVATYAFGTDEAEAFFFYNYTNVTLTDDNFEDINFAINGDTIVGANDELSSEDPTLRMSPVIIQIANNTNLGSRTTTIPPQISGKPSNVAPNASNLFIEVLKVSEDDANVCAPFVAPGQSFDFSFAFECIDDDECRSGLQANSATINGTAVNDEDSNGGANASAYTDNISLTFADAGGGRTAAPINFNYPDAGNTQLHVSFDIPLSLDPDNIAARPAGADTPLFSSSNVFTVRPFAFDIDFSNDRATTPLVLTDGESYALDSDGTTFEIAGDAFSTTVTAVQWEAGDDLNSDGVPDSAAILANNQPTPNFGKDSTAGSYKAGISSVTTAPAGGYGTLSNTDFATFDVGFEEQDMTFDEVGIINLTANLQSTGGTVSANYLSSGESITGFVTNVGRFYPASLELQTVKDIVSRARARSETMCLAPSNDFTYMGEDFGIRGTLEAQNSDGDRTVNYVDGFAKFFTTRAADLDVDKFTASVTLAGPDTILSTRLSSGSPSGPTLAWAVSGAFVSPAAAGDRGLGELSGNLQFNRQSSGVEDGPYPAVSIGLSSTDSDGVAIELTADLDDVGGNDVVILASEAFRYGRLLLQNSYGPETENLDIPLQIQYWDGSSFIVNTDDSCTVIFHDGGGVGAVADRSVRFLTDAGSYEDNLADGETYVEATADAMDPAQTSSNITISILGGETSSASSADVNMDDRPDDRPLDASAPGLGNEGSVVIEFNLTDPQLPYPLDFLSYDWRTAGELEDDTQDAIYTDNPRSRLEFGSYRGHDRVINWREIYIGPD